MPQGGLRISIANQNMKLEPADPPSTSQASGVKRPGRPESQGGSGDGPPEKVSRTSDR